MAFSVVNIDEVERSGPGGVIRFVRRELGAEAFGINWFELPADAVGHEHSEANSGQEEVVVVIQGSGHWLADGEQIPATVGTFIRFDPETVRCPVASEEGMTFVAVGAQPGAYMPHGPF